MLAGLISQGLLLKEAFVLKIARSASKRYKSYDIPKAKGGHRRIYHPSRELKVIQRWLADNIIGSFPVHKAAAAYQKGLGIQDHAGKHKTSYYLLRMDFKDFFPSLTGDDITKHLTSFASRVPEGWSSEDTDLLIRLVCRNGCLTIGAVTSPSLSNTLCYHLDEQVTNVCSEVGVTYTRYADDLFFSTEKKDVLISIQKRVEGIVNNLEYPHSLAFNKDKTWHSSKKYRRLITGLVLTSEGNISIGRKKKRLVRSRVFHWNDLSKEGKRSLAGFLAYCKAVEPEFINSLYVKYGAERLIEIRAFMSKNIE